MAAVHLNRQRGQWVLTALAPVLLTLLVIAAACSSKKATTATSTTKAPSTTRPGVSTVKAPEPPPGQPVGFKGLGVGQCLNDVAEPTQRAQAALAVGCEQPHRFEVYDILTYPFGAKKPDPAAPYPGETTVRNDSERACYERFAQYVGAEWTSSDYDIQVWWPSQQSWLTYTDRTIYCGLYVAQGGYSLGSGRGSGR